MAMGIVLISLILFDNMGQRVDFESGTPNHSIRNPNNISHYDTPITTTTTSNNNNNNNNNKRTSLLASSLLDPPFRFHVYDVPEQYGEGALRLLQETWPISFCNRRIPKTNYTMLDWRHALSLFTADVWMIRHIRSHPAHTTNPAEADVFIIPIIPHVYHCAHVSHYMMEVVRYIRKRYDRYVNMYNQHDHYIFWWRWALHHRSAQGFWRYIQRRVPNIKLISYELLEIMGRNDYQDFSLALKPNFLNNILHVIVPYPDMAPILREVPDLNKPRSIFFYFAGTHTIGGIRRWIRRNCEQIEQEKQNNHHNHNNNNNNNNNNNSYLYSYSNICVYESFASTGVTAARLGVPQSYPEQMRRSVFCGHAAGDALSSRRPTSAVLAGCIPVIICDLCIMPFESIIDYRKFAVFLPEDIVIAGRMIETLQKIPKEKIKAMQRELYRVRSRFLYTTSNITTTTTITTNMNINTSNNDVETDVGKVQPNDALDTLVQELALRGALLRQYRRWWETNRHLSSLHSDYPPIPPARRRYMLPLNVSGAAKFNEV
ncbi:Exostosin [Trypanosoma melophagium]|uniref:Exostosin n=1 Tax=Trypanosoma melophagium TaxID=715481 RepID=UPI00351A4BDE|nr:Exostosin [Trypanosoma melophagium]